MYKNLNPQVKMSKNFFAHTRIQLSEHLRLASQRFK